MRAIRGILVLVLVAAPAAAEPMRPAVAAVEVTQDSHAAAVAPGFARVTLPLVPDWLGDQLAPQDDASNRARALTVFSRLMITTAKKPAKHSFRWLPDLTFKNGGVRIALATKW